MKVPFKEKDCLIHALFLGGEGGVCVLPGDCTGRATPRAMGSGEGVVNCLGNAKLLNFLTAPCLPQSFYKDHSWEWQFEEFQPPLASMRQYFPIREILPGRWDLFRPSAFREESSCRGRFDVSLSLSLLTRSFPSPVGIWYGSVNDGSSDVSGTVLYGVNGRA